MTTLPGTSGPAPSNFAPNCPSRRSARYCGVNCAASLSFLRHGSFRNAGHGDAVFASFILFDEYVAQVMVDGKRFKVMAGAALEADVHLVGARAHAHIGCRQRWVAARGDVPVRERLEDALMPSRHAEEFDEDLVTFFAHLHPHCRSPVAGWTRRLRDPLPGTPRLPVNPSPALFECAITMTLSVYFMTRTHFDLHMRQSNSGSRTSQFHCCSRTIRHCPPRSALAACLALPACRGVPACKEAA